MIAKVKTYIHWFVLARCFPAGYRVFVAWLIAVSVFNAGSYFLSSYAPSLFERWLVASQPLVEWMRPYFFAFDYVDKAFGYRHAEMIPAFNNCLAGNVVLFLFFPVWVFVFADFDVRKNFSSISEKATPLFLDAAIGLEDYIFRVFIFNAFVVSGSYFGALRPYGIFSSSANYVFYGFIFYVLAASMSLMLMSIAFKLGRNRDLRRRGIM